MTFFPFSRKICRLWMILITVGVGQMLIIQGIFAATDATSQTHQALQQLKMLQQNLAKPNNNDSDSPNLSAKDLNASNSGNANAVDKPSSGDNGAINIGASFSQDGQKKSKPTAVSDEVIDERAFDGLTKQLFPLSGDKIIELHKDYQNTEFAVAAAAGTPPKPTATSQFVNLSPGSTPPVIRLAQGFVTSLVFLDSTGAPWPISAYDLGDPTSFNIQWDKVSNTLMIQAMKLYNYGNLAVRLKGLNTPVMLTLIPGQQAVDYRVDLRIQGYGPNANNLPLEEGIPPNANDILLHILEGVPPPGSQRLTVTGGDARAWLLGDKIFVRTNLTVLSPGWLGSMTSADGMHAYEMQKSPVLLVSWHGKVMQLKVEGL